MYKQSSVGKQKKVIPHLPWSNMDHDPLPEVLVIHAASRRIIWEDRDRLWEREWRRIGTHDVAPDTWKRRRFRTGLVVKCVCSKGYKGWNNESLSEKCNNCALDGKNLDF